MSSQFHSRKNKTERTGIRARFKVPPSVEQTNYRDGLVDGTGQTSRSDWLFLRYTSNCLFSEFFDGLWVPGGRTLIEPSMTLRNLALVP